MDNIRESHNSIFYIADKTKIIEYNLISKRKQIIHTNQYNIHQYYINDKHKIVVCAGLKNNMYWNNQSTSISSTYPYNFLLINDDIYFQSSSSYICSNFKTTNANLNRYIQSSFSGKRLMIYDPEHWYIKDTPNSIEDIDETNQAYILLDFASPYIGFWITNSDVVIKMKHGQNDMYVVYNVETKNTCIVPLFSNIFDAINYLIVQIEQSVQIYDIQTMKLLNTIQFATAIIFYHKQHKIAITQDLNYYQITNKLTLQKVNIGINYYIDMHTCPNQIMDIITSNNIIDIADDILYCELYQALIKYIP